jgi:SAM-dependent methyltransferase
LTTVDRGQIYEQPAVRQALGETLRPGGLSLTQRALDICALPPGSRVLDAGCGSGATVEYLWDHGYRAAGADLSTVLLQSGRQCRPVLPLVQADSAYLPFAAAQLDAVITECSLSVFSSTDQVLAAFYRMLKRDGYLIITDLYIRNPDAQAALQNLAPGNCLCGALLREELLIRLKKCGFTLKTWEDYSEVLKSMAGAWMAAYTSSTGPGETGGLDALDLHLAVARTKPGYFLLVAEKL